MIKKIFMLILFFIFFFSINALAKPKVKLYLDSSFTKFIMVEKQNCAIHKNKDNYVKFGFKFGNLLFSFGPEVTFGRKIGIDWHRSVQAFISRYQALCTRFNSGSMTKEEYDIETKKLEDIEERMARLEKEALEALDRDADAMFADLDRELNKLSKRSKLDENKIKNQLQKIREELQEP